MKFLRRIFIIFTVLMAFFLLSFLYLNSQFHFQQRDLIYYNDMLHNVQKEIEKGTDEESIEKKYDCQIILSKEINDVELAEMYRNSAFVVDLTVDGKYVGKVAWQDELDRYTISRRGFFGAALVMWIIVLLGGYYILLYLYLYFIRPVEELKNFSVEIAKGNLDTALPIHRQNLFGNFVEAFDLMREQLVAARKRDIEAEKARKELVTELSHDIKTPVAVIKAACEVLEAKAMTSGGDGNRDMLDKIDVISQKADTINLIVSNMMHANLEELEHLEVNPTEEDSRKIAEIFGNLKQYGNIILDNEIPGCLVYMDTLRMEQAIDNVVGNSYKYAGTDIHVSFDTFVQDMPLSEEGKNKKAEFLRIRIHDSGPGVSEDDLPLISEKYYRGKNAEKVAGSGLGFYLVKYYMEKQDGGLEYYNEDGFTVILMVRKV